MKNNLNCDYEIISLCDIKKFNNEIELLRNTSWSQITIPETLNLPKEKPSIKAINKIYINVEAKSLKIIETPSSSVSNVEGIIVTGKKLLIDGNICEKVIYSSCIPNKSLNSVDLRIPFSTYITINSDTDIHNDKFTINSCIEDVSTTILSEKTIFQSTTLFLFANKMPRIPNPPKSPIGPTIYNEIIINSINDTMVTNIKFDIQNKTIFVEYTGEIPNKNVESQEYFSLILRTKDNFIERFSTLETNEDASNFYDDFNHLKFDFDQSIEMRYIDNSKIIITDSLNKTQNFNPNSDEESKGIQIFNITEKGIVL